MRNALLPLLALALGVQSATAQITLEMTRPGQATGGGRMSNGAYKYAFPLGAGQMVIYNADHTVNSQFTVPTLAGYQVPTGIQYLSDQLFDTNPATLEFVVSYTPLGVTNTPYKTIIYNNQAAVLATLDSVAFVSVVNTEVGTKLIGSVFRVGPPNTYRTRFYSLPGHYVSPLRTSDEAAGGDQSERAAYPNPAAGFIRLPYELRAGQTAPLTVLDAAGRVVRTMTVGSAFTDVLLDTHELTPGTYTYRVEGSGGRFVIAQ